jgi:hypothetical protein
MEIATDEDGGVVLTEQIARALVGDILVFAVLGRFARDVEEGRRVIRVFCETLLLADQP